MPPNKELLLSLRTGFEQLELFDQPSLNSLRNRGRTILGQVFGEDSPYKDQLSNIGFHNVGVIITRIGVQETSSERQRRERYWRAGQAKSIALISIMLEDLALGEPDQAQGVSPWSSQTPL
jgi:hypothetical protein